MIKTVVLGATPNPSRYAHFAGLKLKESGHEVIPIGIKKGEVAGKEIIDLREKPFIEEVHTITLYIGSSNQVEWEDYIISLNPKRIIFNPGTENPSLENKARSQGIEALRACTLVMLSADTY